MYILDGFTIYEGNVKHGKDGFLRYNGRGKLTQKDGSTFDGRWENDEPYGVGELMDPDASVFKGEVIFGKKGLLQCHGFGEPTSPDGSSYVRNWSRDKPCGNGKLVWADGAWYKGEIVRNKQHD